MKNNYSIIILLGILLKSNLLIAQSLEDFESESPGSDTFTDQSQVFTISSDTGERYDIFSHGYLDNGHTDNCIGCGWNGTSGDEKFVGNEGAENTDGTDNGSSFSITTGGAEIGITSLYLFCSTYSITPHSGSLTITGKKSGVTQYTITKNSEFSSVVTFTPNNGFTLIDFATEGTSDFTQINIDELVFTSTGNLDYMALDAFSWVPGNTLSANNLASQSQSIVYPNPSSDFINISNLNKTTNYTIFNILGNEISQGSIDENEQVNIQAFSNGLYFISLENGLFKKFAKK